LFVAALARIDDRVHHEFHVKPVSMTRYAGHLSRFVVREDEWYHKATAVTQTFEPGELELASSRAYDDHVERVLGKLIRATIGANAPRIRI
jgi:hypothetical protein